MEKVHIKTSEEIKIMTEGGHKLAQIRDKLEAAVAAGVSAWDIEELANDLIEKSGGQSSFKMVPGYSWSTCVNVDDGVVHGIPKKEIVFKKGQIVSIDVGLFYKGFHTDTSTSVLVDSSDKNLMNFLAVGRKALKNAISEARVGNFVRDISAAYERTLTEAKLTPVWRLTGHGVGRSLHELPYVPCFARGADIEPLELVPGLVLALEIMYTKGNGNIKTAQDGWTIVTQDGKISALFEETVSVDSHGPVVLTKI